MVEWRARGRGKTPSGCSQDLESTTIMSRPDTYAVTMSYSTKRHPNIYAVDRTVHHAVRVRIMHPRFSSPAVLFCVASFNWMRRYEVIRDMEPDYRFCTVVKFALAVKDGFYDGFSKFNLLGSKYVLDGVSDRDYFVDSDVSMKVFQTVFQ
jgi:hypothetical protein